VSERRWPGVIAFVALTVVCATLLAGVAALTEAPIEENRARRFQQTLTAVTGSARLAAEVAWQDDLAPLCPGRVLLRGTAAGYGGGIGWLAAARLAENGPVLERVRITAHQETPGIADFLDRPETGWLARLDGRDAAGLRALDTVSGATITSRALKRDLVRALERPDLAERACPP
jgi:Na+-translocating ferredoxin:NAD+ oxidoreductase RnfG subunit